MYAEETGEDDAPEAEPPEERLQRVEGAAPARGIGREDHRGVAEEVRRRVVPAARLLAGHRVSAHERPAVLEGILLERGADGPLHARGVDDDRALPERRLVRVYPRHDGGWRQGDDDDVARADVIIQHCLRHAFGDRPVRRRACAVPHAHLMACLRGRLCERPADQAQSYYANIHLAYNSFWKQQKQLVKTTSSFSPRNRAALLKPGAVAPG